MDKRVVPVVIAVIAACGGKAIIDAGSGGAGSTTTSTSITTSTSTSTSSSGNHFDACDGAGQCMMAWPGCCEGCMEPELDDLVPINKSQADAYHLDQCPEAQPCPQCIGCPNGNLFAYCDNGTCRGADLRVHELSKCDGPTECSLRAGSDCCENCGEIGSICGGLVAINQQQQGELTKLVCEDGIAACPPCVPLYPDEAFADCIDGHCQVVISNQ